ncbi:MAG TPA: hypothetical protein VF788_14110 [Pseudonocardiaceae bacterium]
MWPEPDRMATLSAYLPAAEAVGVFAVLAGTPAEPGIPAMSAAWTRAGATPWSIRYSTPPATAAQAPVRFAHAPPSQAILPAGIHITQNRYR